MTDWQIDETTWRMGAGELAMADGILFGKPELAATFDADIIGNVKVWRVTFGGKLLAHFDRSKWDNTVFEALGRQTWRWPVIPLYHRRRAWITGTVASFVGQFITETAQPERNYRKPSCRVPGRPSLRVSHKLAHRVVWADRRRGLILTDPLYRVTFTDLEDALAFLEEKRERERAKLPTP